MARAAGVPGVRRSDIRDGSAAERYAPATRLGQTWPPVPRPVVPPSAIMAQTGHRSTDMVRRYIRETNLFASDNSASLAGL